jgi:hypothetical protein
MKKIIKLTEQDLEKIVKKVLQEQNIAGTSRPEDMGYLQNINPSNLKLGDKGEDVKVLQQKLMKIGLLKTKSMIPTGYFGELTNAALSKYLSKPVKKQVKGQEKPQEIKQYKFSPRIDAELGFIRQRGLDDKPFFIYDPKDNLIFLFNTDSKFVDYSTVIDGADAQKEKEQSKAYTVEDWCKTSGLDVTPFRCTDPATKTKKDPYYSVLSNLKTRFIPKGIYSIGLLYHHEGYEGTGQNTFQMVDNKGKSLSAAIHGIPSGLPERLKASKDLEYLLKKDLSSGKVPEKYLNSIKTISNANQSFGCIGVPAKFINNPNVKGIAKGARVFVMGESGKSFLVSSPNEFFNKISGDGQNCVNPESVAVRMSTMV